AAHRQQDHPPQRELHRAGRPEVRADRKTLIARIDKKGADGVHPPPLLLSFESGTRIRHRYPTP
ncbi:hypothetical protein PP728_21280, partial [Ralstonia solanacearum]|uniref:hypothetical protein n=1 Tax=Ralstonia solanacearum TaxID=305 RepID=UPI00202AA4E1